MKSFSFFHLEKGDWNTYIYVPDLFSKTKVFIHISQEKEHLGKHIFLKLLVGKQGRMQNYRSHLKAQKWKKSEIERTYKSCLDNFVAKSWQTFEQTDLFPTKSNHWELWLYFCWHHHCKNFPLFRGRENTSSREEIKILLVSLFEEIKVFLVSFCRNKNIHCYFL